MSYQVNTNALTTRGGRTRHLRPTATCSLRSGQVCFKPELTVGTRPYIRRSNVGMMKRGLFLFGADINKQTAVSFLLKHSFAEASANPRCRYTVSRYVVRDASVDIFLILFLLL